MTLLVISSAGGRYVGSVRVEEREANGRRPWSTGKGQAMSKKIVEHQGTGKFTSTRKPMSRRKCARGRKRPGSQVVGGAFSQLDNSRRSFFLED
jgi:hypothetical protein